MNSCGPISSLLEYIYYRAQTLPRINYCTYFDKGIIGKNAIPCRHNKGIKMPELPDSIIPHRKTKLYMTVMSAGALFKELDFKSLSQAR
jgi:hypothetical protein